MKKLLIGLSLLASMNAFSSDGLVPCKIEGIYYHQLPMGTIQHAYRDASFYNFNTFEKCYEKAKEIAEKNNTYTRDSSFRVEIGGEAVNFLPYSKKFPVYYRYSTESPEGSDEYNGRYDRGSVTKFTNQYDNGLFLRGNAKFTKSGDIVETNN
jgi:hypothetical protein